MTIKRLRWIAPIASLLVPSAAYAHTGVGETSGLIHGFSHPIGGLDHVLAMVMVGMLAYQLGGRAIWALPATFVAVMALGGGLGMAGIEVPFVEAGIALSVILLGAALAFGLRAPVVVTAAVVGVFAVFHGYAHGAEMPETAAGLSYASGFLIATAMLHAAGLAAGYAFGRMSGTFGIAMVRTAGVLASLVGVGLITGTL